MVDPAISFYYFVHYELAPTFSMTGHTSIAMNKKLDVGLAELWVKAREGDCFVTVLALK
jgi:hypothetical protein